MPCFDHFFGCSNHFAPSVLLSFHLIAIKEVFGAFGGKMGQVVVEIWICSEPSFRLGSYSETANNEPPHPNPNPSFHRDTGGFDKQELTQ